LNTLISRRYFFHIDIFLDELYACRFRQHAARAASCFRCCFSFSALSLLPLRCHTAPVFDAVFCQSAIIFHYFRHLLMIILIEFSHYAITPPLSAYADSQATLRRFQRYYAITPFSRRIIFDITPAIVAFDRYGFSPAATLAERH
jgi:hypothetical protein